MKGMIGSCSADPHAAETCCCVEIPAHRHFFTAAEKKEHLEKYREQLEKELEGVRERIEQLS